MGDYSRDHQRPSVRSFIANFRGEFFENRSVLEEKAGIPLNLNVSEQQGYIEITSYNPKEWLARQVVAEFKISIMNPNSYIAISHGVVTSTSFRGRGLGKMLHSMRLRAFKKSNFQLVMCSVNMENTNELKILSAFGWTKANEFRTVDGAKDGLWVLNLSESFS